MVSNLNILYYSLGKREEVSCNFTLNSKNNFNILSFESDKFLFNLTLKDLVDLDEFFNFLNKKEKKIELYCYLKKENKYYKGMRKLLWKNNNIAVSQGGARIEFEKEAQDFLFSVIKTIKKF